MRQAGETLLRTPSAISQSISSLERGLGLQLFIRAGIRLELTEPGRLLLQKVRESEQSLTAILDSLRGDSALVRGQVALGLPPGYPAISIADELSSALLTYPELQLRLRFLTHSELEEGLRKNWLEMALSLQPLKQWNRRIKSIELREENLILAIPSRFRHFCSSELTELPVVDYYQKPLMIESWLKHHKKMRVKTYVRVYASNLDHVLQMVHKGVGCAVVPRHVVADELASGALLEHNLDKRRPWIVQVWLNAAKSPEQFSRSALCIWQALLGR